MLIQNHPLSVALPNSIESHTKMQSTYNSRKLHSHNLGTSSPPTWTMRVLVIVPLLWTLTGTSKAGTMTFPIATGGAVMSFASDGSNFLAGVEDHLSTPSTIGAQLLSANGTPVGPLIPTGRSGIATAVAFDGTNYLLIWEDDGLGTLNGNTGWKIFGQFISKAGALVGTPFPITSAGIWFDGIKTIAFGGGKYLVTYTRLINPANGAQSNNRYVAGRLVNPDGSLENEFRISSGYGNASDVVFGANQFFVVWCEDGADKEIRGRFLTQAGVPGTEISVNASPAPSDNPKSVAFDGINFLVVWNDEVGGAGTYTWDCFGQIVSPTGALVGGVITLTDEPGPQMVTSLASDGTHYLAVWMDMSNPSNWDSYCRFLTCKGAYFGDKTPISTAPGNQMCGVGYANGKFIIAINNGIVMNEGGIAQIDASSGMIFNPPSDPQIQTADSAFGLGTNRFGFTITGYTNVVVIVEASASLRNPNWIPIQTNVLSGGSSYFSEPNWQTYPARFYRLRTP
jgi:hypothetical protein